MKQDRAEGDSKGVLATEVASTPSPFSAVASEEVLEQLEFRAALEGVAEHAVSSIGAESVCRRIPVQSLSVIEAELRLVAELQSLLDSGDRFRPEAVPDLRDVIDYLAVAGTVLEPENLNRVRVAVEGMNAVRGELERVAAEAPSVGALAREVPPVEVARRIGAALDADGAVKDDASPALAKARRRVRDTRSRLVALLDRQLKHYGEDSGAGGVTLHGDRYVIPVRRDDRNRVQGIVHGESSSGATLFVEPPEAVELGNELSSWEAEEARAVLAVIRELSALVASHGTELASGLEMCREADDAYARARYAVETDGHSPTMVESPAAVEINRGVHPLLSRESDRPVAFDLELCDGERTLLVSGPNAGGKTVILKAVGLCTALAQAGVIPPVGPKTVLPVFTKVFADIGDHQSIAASLSTFSAHMAALKEILGEADVKSLVLLDEVGGGTDPTEGAALAGAVLLSLNSRGCTTVATTHLGELKDLAAETDGVANGSLQFDVETLAPTYRFIKDQPGRSYGLAIARRMGLPEDVLRRAEALVPEQARSLDAVLAEVERKEEEVTRREAEAANEAAQLAKLRRENEALLESLNERQGRIAGRERELEREGREQARQFLLQARRRVEDALGAARAADTKAAAREARRMVEEGVTQEAEAIRRLERAGFRVAGPGSVKRDQSLGDGGTGKREGALPHYRSTAVLPSSSDLDLRGLTGDEAESALVLAIDSAVADDLPWLRIIHGKGTGVLRARVGQVLKRDRRVAGFKLAPPEQGGTGVTMVEFKT